MRPVTVYRIYGYGEGFELLYVGCSKNPLHRITIHRRKPWGQRVTCYRLTEYDTADEAIAAERLAISTEHPEFNIAGKTPEHDRT